MGEVNVFALSRIAGDVLAQSATTVGCKEHHENVTKMILNNYVVARSKMFAKGDEENNDEEMNFIPVQLEDVHIITLGSEDVHTITIETE